MINRARGVFPRVLEQDAVMVALARIAPRVIMPNVRDAVHLTTFQARFQMRTVRHAKMRTVIIIIARLVRAAIIGKAALAWKMRTIRMIRTNRVTAVIIGMAPHV